MVKWWAFAAAFLVGVPTLIGNTYNSPAWGYVFKGYMVVVFIANLVHIIHCIRRKRRSVVLSAE